ncbi:unnamed protein product [Rotaria socialis]
MAIIIGVHKPCYTVTNLLACNTNVFVATFQLNSLIGSVYGFYSTSSEYQPVCIFRAVRCRTSITGTCYSYALQSIWRLYFAVFYKYKYLVTFRVHWYMIASSWIISIGILAVSLASPGLLGLDKKVRLSTINVKLLRLTLFGLAAGLPRSFIPTIGSENGLDRILHENRQEPTDSVGLWDPMRQKALLYSTSKKVFCAKIEF